MTQQRDNSEIDDALITVAMELAMEDEAVTLEMKEALQAGRWRDALLCACKLTGFEPTDAIKQFPQPGRDPEQEHGFHHVM